MLRCFASLALCALLVSFVSAEDVTWLAEVATPPEEFALKANGSQAIDKPWPEQREAIRDEWKQFLGAYSYPDLPLKMETVQEEKLEHCTRRLIRYQAEPGRIVRAYLLIPHGDASTKRPAIAAFHGTSTNTFDKLVGLAAEPARHMALRLVEQGFIVLCPENFLWEQSSYQKSTEAALKPHPQSKGMAVMLADCMRAVDVLLTMEDVDPQRIGAYGHSLGAKEAFYLAAMDDRVCAAVASEGGIEIGFSNWDAIWYLSDEVNAKDFRLKHSDLVRLIAGRPFLVLGGEEGRGCADGERSWKALHEGQKAWQANYPGPVRMGLYNHGEGHSLSMKSGDRILDWMNAYVKNRGENE